MTANVATRSSAGAGDRSRRERRTSAESTFGTGQKTWRPMVRALGVRPPGGLRRRHAVGAAAGPGGEPVGDLRLHHDEDPLEARQVLEGGEQDRHGHVVREVRHERRRRLAGQEARVGKSHGVRLDDLEAPRGGRRELGDGLRQCGRQRRVDLDRDDVRLGLQQRERERAETGTDLEDPLARADARGAHDAANGSGVVHEVLAERLRGADPEPAGERADVGGAQQADGGGFTHESTA
jgi:hypothetical protein